MMKMGLIMKKDQFCFLTQSLERSEFVLSS